MSTESSPSIPLYASLKVALLEDQSCLHLTLAMPKGNVLDGTMIADLAAAVEWVETLPQVRSILVEGEGRHFSFGASVEEHRPAQVEEMLKQFHRLFRLLAGSRRVLLAAVRGQCLGGGLELASFCHRVVASPDAMLGNPEVKLGVFAPAASAVLPQRVGQAHADWLLLSGRSITAETALSWGLVDALADQPTEALLQWHRENLVPHSASSLRHVVRAARRTYYQQVFSTLDALEQDYLEALMHTHDAVEGITAFLEKRSPQWTHH